MPEEDSKRMWIPRWIIDEVLEKMSDAEVRVFLVYSRHANKEGLSWPGNPLVAYKTGLSIRSVQRAVKSLLDKGLMTKISKGTGGRRVFTKYQIISQTWKDYQASRTMPRTTVEGASEDSQDHETASEQGPSEAVSGVPESVSKPELSTNPATPVMVCGKQQTKGDNRESGYCGKLSTKGDTAVMEGRSRSKKPCHPCRKTMTPGVVNHDRAMSTEVIKKKFFKRHAVGKDQNHDNGKRQKTATTGIEGAIKKLFRSVNSVCNTRRKAGTMIQDLRRHLAKQETVAV